MTVSDVCLALPWWQRVGLFVAEGENLRPQRVYAGTVSKMGSRIAMFYGEWQVIQMYIDRTGSINMKAVPR